MAMDEAVLEEAIIGVLKAVTPQLLPDVQKGVEVVEVPLEDGSSTYTTVTNRGPAEVTEDGENAIRPLARAIATAVVEHITANAEITGTGVGTDWRIE